MLNTNYPLVTIVVLHWKNYRSTQRTLESIRRVSYTNYNVILVDNFSDDGSVERLHAEFPSVRVLCNKENLGFSRGCNKGIIHACENGAEYVLLLNNDVELEPGSLTAAVTAAQQQSSIGLITGKILLADRRTIWQAGGYISKLRVQGVARGWGENDQGQYDQICQTHWASGAMLLIPRSTIDLVGLLPEEYFFGVEEWDYSTSVEKSGLKILYVPTFQGYHDAGKSYKAGHPVLIVYNGMRNKMVYAQKHMSPILWRLWKILFRFYLSTVWTRRAHWGCSTDDDYRARLRAARLALADHRGIHKIELTDLQRAAIKIGPTPTWGEGWEPVNAET